MVYGLYECSAGFDQLTSRQCKPAWGSLPTSYIEPFPKNLSFLYLHLRMSQCHDNWFPKFMEHLCCFLYFVCWKNYRFQMWAEVFFPRKVASIHLCEVCSKRRGCRNDMVTCPTRDDVWICFVCVSLYPIFGTSFQLPSPPFSQEKTRCHRRISPVRSLLCIAHLTQGWVWTATEWYMALYNMKAGHAKKCLVGQWLKRWYGIDSS